MEFKDSQFSFPRTPVGGLLRVRDITDTTDVTTLIREDRHSPYS